MNKRTLAAVLVLTLCLLSACGRRKTPEPAVSSSQEETILKLDTLAVELPRDLDTAAARKYAPGTPLPLEAVQSENFVCLTKGHSSRITQDKLFRRFGLTPNVILETDALEVGRRVALEAGACMLLPSIYIDDYCRQRRGAFFPLKDYENHRHFYACYRKDEFVPRYVRDFIQITTQVLAKQQRERP